MMKKVYIETYGCRMNLCDSEIIIRIITENGFEYTSDIKLADIVILNSCSVREVGHNKIYERLNIFNSETSFIGKKIVITGCFASLLTDEIFESYPIVDLIVHPKCYKALPFSLNRIEDGEKHIILSDSDCDEIYEDVFPLRQLENKTTAAIVIMKGCNQACSYCIEPVTRGKEVCKSLEAIVKEVNDAVKNGYKEINLVGHSIDKYKSLSKTNNEYITFALLLDKLAREFPDLRIKFMSSHPLYLSDEILHVIATNSNIMRVVHFPIQSASDRILKAMNRQYDMKYIRRRLKRIREIVPDMSVVTDIMVGFCSETDEDFQATYDFLSSEYTFNDINIFKYSMRPYTAAHKNFTDDVPEEIKQQRYDAVLQLRDAQKTALNQAMVGHTVKILVEDVEEYGEKIVHEHLTLIYFFIFGRDQYNNNVRYEVRVNSRFIPSVESMLNTQQDVTIYEADKTGLRGIEYSF